MDPLIEAIYRSGCLVAASRLLPEIKSLHHGDVQLEELVKFSNALFERVVPDDQRAGEVVPADWVAEPHPAPEAFLEDARRRAAEQLDAKDKQKMARAAAIADEENTEFAPREGDLGVQR